MAAMMGSEGPVLWMVAVLLMLTVGLTGALLAAIRSGDAAVPGGRPRTDPGNRHLT